MKRRGRHGRIEHRRFIVTWQEARHVRDVLERLGLPESSRAYVMRRAARYRRMGVLEDVLAAIRQHLQFLQLILDRRRYHNQYDRQLHDTMENRTPQLGRQTTCTQTSSQETIRSSLARCSGSPIRRDNVRYATNLYPKSSIRAHGRWKGEGTRHVWLILWHAWQISGRYIRNRGTNLSASIGLAHRT